MRVDDPGALPLPNTVSPDPNDTVVGIDFSGASGTVISQINAALAGTNMSATLAGNTLEVLDDGAGNQVDVNAVSTTTTTTGLASGIPQFPFFTDGSNAYTGAITSRGSELTGFAQRIAVNPAVAGDPSKLIAYQSGTPAGDNTRPDFMYQQLTNTAMAFSPDTGVGTVTAPFVGSLTTYLRQVLSQQGEAATSASNLQQGQDVVLNTLQQQFNSKSGVNVDQEMANLLTLQNSYSANARVLSAVKDMFDALINMGLA
jgi:flagellar hook-associated protein 1 FlgK